MQLTENDLDFLMEKIYQFNQAHPATLEEIRMHAISSRKILCRRCKWHGFEYKWDEFFNQEMKRVPHFLILMVFQYIKIHYHVFLNLNFESFYDFFKLKCKEDVLNHVKD